MLNVKTFVVVGVIVAAIIGVGTVMGQDDSVCVTGGAVPTGSAGLISDCETLLGVKSALRGSAKLNWWSGRSIEKWDGITVENGRVVGVSLPNRSLNGVIPTGFGSLSTLKTLDLSSNSLTGTIPASLNSLTALTKWRLAGNGLSGCVPYNFAQVSDNDLASLGLSTCGGSGPAPTAVPTTVPTTVPTAVPQTHSRIVFASNRDGNPEIYVMNPDGSGQTRLTDDPAVDGSPSWSPDGRRIAFESNRDGNREIYVMNADGSNQTRLTDNPAVDSSPSWSPDGHRIVFQSSRDGNGEIYVMNADGSDQTRLTSNSGSNGAPSWSVQGVPTPTPTATPTPTPEPTTTPDLAPPRMIAAGGTNIVLQSAAHQGSGAEFQWSQLSGPSVELVDASAEHARFTAPVVVEDTDLVFKLKAEYQNGDVVLDTVPIRIVPKKAQKVLAALVDFLDVDPEERPLTREDVLDLLESNDDSLRVFMSHTSRQLVDIDIDVLDWITVNKNRADYPLDGGTVLEDAVSRMSDFADLSQYDKVMPFIFPLDLGEPGCSAYLDKVGFDTPNGHFELGASWLSGYDMGCARKGRIAHEFGHTFGFYHSGGIATCSGRIPIPPVPDSLIDPTYKEDYCERDYPFGQYFGFDIMGGDNDTFVYEPFFPLHFHANWQETAGWLTSYQVPVVQNSGEYILTTLESLTPNPKAIKIPLGTDLRDDLQHYWLETRVVPSGPVALRGMYDQACQINIMHQGEIARFSMGISNGWSFGDNTYEYGWWVEPDRPFWDPHRGVRVEMLECTGAGTLEETVRLRVSFTQFDVDTPVVTVFNDGEATSTFTNNTGTRIDIGSASLGGRHPEAFVIHSDECSSRTLEPGASCRITVRYTSADSQLDKHGFLKVPNSDTLAPDMTVSLYQAGDSTLLPDACVQHIAPGRIEGSWSTDCVSATWIPIYNARFYTFTLETQTDVSISVDSDEIPKIFLHHGKGVGGARVAESTPGDTAIRDLTLQAGSYTIEVTTYISNRTGDFVLTLGAETQ